MNDQAAFQQRINYGDPLLRDEYIKLHEAERELSRARRDVDLRLRCIEIAHGDTERAEVIYTWVRNKPKADAA